MAEYHTKEKTDLFDPKDAERYLLYSKPEIVRVLRDLAKKPEIITAYYNGGSGYFLTAILGVLSDPEVVVLDCGSDEAQNALALKSDHIVCVARHEHVKVRFTCKELQKARFQGRPAFAAPLPESVYRPQRREFFRVTTPVYNPLRLRVPRSGAEPSEFAVVDLSCGGIGVHDSREEFPAEPGTFIEGCSVELPGFGRITVDLVVRNCVKMRGNDGSEARRVGCQFKSLAMDANALIQRYLHKLQFEAKRQHEAQ